MIAELADNLQSTALLIMSITGGFFLLFIAWKGRTFVAKYKELEVTLNPQTLQEFSVKMDEVVKSVNNKGPDDPTLFQTVKSHTTQLHALNVQSAANGRQLSRMDAKLDTLIEDLKVQVGLRITTAPVQPKD